MVLLLVVLLLLLLQRFDCFKVNTLYRSNHLELSSYIDNHEEERIHSRDISELIYLDNDIIVYNKACNVQSAPGYVSKDSLATDIKTMLNLPRIDQMIVHRLDYATSGLIVYARNEFALKDLHAQFRNKNKVYKVYSAIVSGVISSYEGEINLPLTKDVERGPPLQKVDAINGKSSFTKWKIKEIGNDVTHVHLQPLTGRTHQLRTHLAAIGHPIIGDLFYAPHDIYLKSNRLLLHAEEIRFQHPRTREYIKFRVDPPFSITNF